MFGLTALSRRLSSRRSLRISETKPSEPRVEARPYAGDCGLTLILPAPLGEKPRELASAFPPAPRSILLEPPRTSFPPRSDGRRAPFATEQRCSVYFARLRYSALEYR